ncbi:GNAT family N-acetyltransferase [Actinomadura rubrisoli]|uniref:GNAT family N-acetyltransferase n=1 Tax=Actinomadura rubrisoli TaxID=2530368 RepID=UPI001A9D3F42|nr:GNAT family N-acetyltransferase [Actinomadura rubrisoli]
MKVRAATEDEWDALDAVLGEAYGREQPPDVRAVQRGVFEVDRALVAEDGDRMCGCLACFSLRVSAPGGVVVPTAGVTWGGVLPTHRRRGVLTMLLRHLLDEIRQDGREPLAALFTTEPQIYGRYGFGPASQEISLSIPRHVLGNVPGDQGIRLTSVDPAEALTATERIYADVVPLRPGMPVRDDAWARYVIADPPSMRAGASRLRCVLAHRGGTTLGYVRYATAARTDHGLPAGTVRLRDIAATEPAAYAALWRFVLDMDLTSTIAVARLPVDDALLHLMADPRAARPTVSDQLQVRLVDVGRALASRRYARDVDVVLRVDDPFCPWNTRHWRLSADSTGAVCEPTAARPDISLDAADLGSIYLGGFTLRALAQTGRVNVADPAALAAVSRAFSNDLAPFCPHRF